MRPQTEHVRRVASCTLLTSNYHGRTHHTCPACPAHFYTAADLALHANRKQHEPRCDFTSGLAELGIVWCPPCSMWCVKFAWNELGLVQPHLNKSPYSWALKHQSCSDTTHNVILRSASVPIPIRDPVIAEIPDTTNHTVVARNPASWSSLIVNYPVLTWARSTRPRYSPHVHDILLNYVQDIRKLSNLLLPFGRFPIWVSDRGDCLFIAITIALIQAGFLDIDVQSVRHKVADSLLLHWDELIEFLRTDDSENSRALSRTEYTAAIRNMTSWGGDPEIAAASIAFDVSITVIQPGANPLLYDRPNRPQLFIGYNNRGHYFATVDNQATAFIHNKSVLSSIATYHHLVMPSDFPILKQPPMDQLPDSVVQIIPPEFEILPACLLTELLPCSENPELAVSDESSAVSVLASWPSSDPTPTTANSSTGESECEFVDQEDLQWEELREDLARTLESAPSSSNVPPIINVCDVANHPRINPNIHTQNRPLWTQCVREVMKSYLACDSIVDVGSRKDKKMACLVKLLCLPGHLLATRKGKKKQNKSITQQRNILLGLFDSIPTLQPKQSVAKPVTRSDSSAEANKFAASRAKRVETLTGQGYIGRAANTWTQTAGLADLSTEDSINSLKSLHPPCLSALPNPPQMLDNTPPVILQPSEVVKLVKSMDNGSSPGPSGWTARLIRFTLNDEICCEGFTHLLNDILHNKLPDEAKEFLLSCNLVASPKDNGGLRPIAIAEIFHRLAAKAAVNSVVSKLDHVWNGIQLGINVSGGVETALHTLHMNLRHFHPDLHAFVAGLLIDCKNAFNDIDRAAVLKAVYSNPDLAPIWPIVQFSYSQPSHLLTRNAEGKLIKSLLSQQGVKQGDPLAALLFALTVQPMYNRIAQLPGVQAAAIHDDLSLIGTPQALLDAWPIVVEEAAKLSLKVQPKKSQFVYFHQDSHPLPQQLIDQLTLLEIKIHFEETTVLGCPIAKNDIILQRCLRSTIRNIIQSINTCMGDKNVTTQSAMLILRSSFTQKIDYLMRCLGRSVFNGLESEFHNNIISIALERSGINPADDHLSRPKSLMTLPLKVGGLGLAPHSVRIDYCFISSLIAASVTQTSMRGVHSILSENHADLISVVDSALSSCHTLAEHKLGSHLPSSCAQFTGRFVPGQQGVHLHSLQHSLSRFAQKSMIKCFESTANTDEEKLHWFGVSARGSTNWLKCLPTSSYTRVQDDLYGVGMMIHLDIPLHCYKALALDPFTDDFCPACGMKNAFGLNKFHMLSCNSLKPHRTRKHTALLECLNAILQRVNVQSIKEPMNRYCTSEHTAEQRRLRPDLEVYMGSQSYHLDISNVDQHATSHRVNALGKRGGAITHRENKKTLKYKGATDLLRCTSFVPIIFDRYGAMGKQSIAFFKLFARFCRENCLIDTPKELMTSLYDSFSCIVVKENAKMILDHLSIMSTNITQGKFSADQPTLSRNRVSTTTATKKCSTSLKRSTSVIQKSVKKSTKPAGLCCSNSDKSVAKRSVSVIC